MVPLTAPLKAIIDEHGTRDRHADDYVFSIFKRGMSEVEKLTVNRNFIGFVNDDMKRLAKSLGYDFKIGTLLPP